MLTTMFVFLVLPDLSGQFQIRLSALGDTSTALAPEYSPATSVWLTSLPSLLGLSSLFTFFFSNPFLFLHPYLLHNSSMIFSGLGFNIVGGTDQQYVSNDSGIYVSRIKENGAAALDGRLQEGDKILSVRTGFGLLHCPLFPRPYFQLLTLPWEDSCLPFWIRKYPICRVRYEGPWSVIFSRFIIEYGVY